MESVVGVWFFVGGTSRPDKIRQGQTDTDTQIDAGRDKHRQTRQDKTRVDKTR